MLNARDDQSMNTTNASCPATEQNEDENDYDDKSVDHNCYYPVEKINLRCK